MTTEDRGEGQREVSRMTETITEIENSGREPSICVVCCCYYRFGGGLVGGQQSIMNLVLDMLGLRFPWRSQNEGDTSSTAQRRSLGWRKKPSSVRVH